jgi:probable F420-dependent oxidoreductase
VPVEGRLLAALGPRMLELAASRTLGAHPYMTTPTHTASARARIGSEGFLAPEQRLVITGDPNAGMEVARTQISRYLTIANYRKSLLAMGYSSADLEGGGSDGLISDLAAIGGPVEAVERVEAHLTAGADHVAIQVFGSSEEERLRGFRALAPVLRQDQA